MSFDKIRAATVKQFTDNWVAGAPTGLDSLSRVELPNVRFERPSTGAFASLSLALADRDAAAIGATRIRTIGFVFVVVSVPEDSGTKLLNDAGDALATLFDNAQVEFLDSTGWVSFGFVTPAGANARADGFVSQTYRVSWQHDENS